MHDPSSKDIYPGYFPPDSLIHSAISVAPLQVLYYSEALPTTARMLYRSFQGRPVRALGDA